MTPQHISIQPAQTAGPADYDPRRPLPMPYRLDEDGMVLDQDFWEGDPHSCIGFMSDPDCKDPEQMLLLDHVTAADPSWQILVGRHPVFCTAGGRMWNDTRAITDVRVAYSGSPRAGKTPIMRKLVEDVSG